MYHPSTGCASADDRMEALEARAAGVGSEARVKCHAMCLARRPRRVRNCSPYGIWPRPRRTARNARPSRCWCDGLVGNMAIEKTEGCSKVLCGSRAQRIQHLVKEKSLEALRMASESHLPSCQAAEEL